MKAALESRRFLLYLVFFFALFIVMWQRESQQIALHEGVNGVSAEAALHIFVVERFIDAQQFMRQREVVLNQAGDERKKLRWAYKTVEAGAYSLLLRWFDLQTVRYVALLHYVFIVFATFVTCVAIWKRIANPPNDAQLVLLFLCFLGAISSVFVVANWKEDFTVIEMLALALTILFSIKGRTGLVLLSIFVGVTNRESGIVLGMVAALLIAKPWPTRFILASSGFFFLFVLNFDVLASFVANYSVVLLHTGAAGNPRGGLLNPGQVTLSDCATFALFLVAFLAPLVLFAREGLATNIGRRAAIIVSGYLLVFLVGSYLTNFFLYLILIPPIVLYAAAVRSVWIEGPHGGRSRG